MKKRAIFALAAALCACSSAAPSATGSAGFPEAPYAALASNGGAYRVEVRTSPEQPPERGELEVELRITDGEGTPIDPPSLDVVPWMPAMGHGASVVPDVQREALGVYRLSRVELFMPGTWQLRIVLGGDRLVAPITVQ